MNKAFPWIIYFQILWKHCLMEKFIDKETRRLNDKFSLLQLWRHNSSAVNTDDVAIGADVTVIQIWLIDGKLIWLMIEILLNALNLGYKRNNLLALYYIKVLGTHWSTWQVTWYKNCFFIITKPLSGINQISSMNNFIFFP